MKINYDLHIHTALSPCALEEMTPNNIVNMSLICELDVIAITDHNSCENIQGVMKVAEKTDLVVIPGIEVETAEEIHMICLFNTLEEALAVQKVIYDKLPTQQNNAKIFGEQTVLNEEDDVVAHVDRLLSFASNISVDKLVSLVHEIGGVCVPAHIDRPSYSIISNLGILPEHLSFPVLEISRYSQISDYLKKYKEHYLIQSSDAHELGVIGTCHKQMAVENRTVESVINRLRSVM